MPISASGTTSKVTRLFADRDGHDALRGAARAWVSRGVEAAQGAGDIARDARDLVEDAAAQAARTARKLADEIRANPLRSSALALAGGLLLGLLLPRR